MYPHCDQLVLHAPGECIYCDKHPDWQQARIDNGINFTGHSDADKQPDPATIRRTQMLVEHGEWGNGYDTLNQWPGNQATPTEEDAGRW